MVTYEEFDIIFNLFKSLKNLSEYIHVGMIKHDSNNEVTFDIYLKYTDDTFVMEDVAKISLVKSENEEILEEDLRFLEKRINKFIEKVNKAAGTKIKDLNYYKEE